MSSRSFLHACAAGALLFAIGCDGGNAPPPVDAGGLDDAWTEPDAGPPDTGPPFMTADHPQLPIVVDHRGPALAAPELVVITYADDPNRATLEEHARWAVGSTWLTTVGSEYGIGAGTILANVERTDNAPDVIDDAEVQTLLASGIVDGSLPTPPEGTFQNALYMIYFPRHTTVTETAAGGAMMRSCESFGGYHYQATTSTGVTFAYAVIPTCPGGSGLSSIESQEVAVTHEIIEAATDPFPITRPGVTFDEFSGSPWLLVGPEIGDLCALRVGPGSVYREGSFVATRVWSNAVAWDNNRDPCLPADPTVPYYTVGVTPNQIQSATPGGTVTFDLAGWSTAPVASWVLYAQAAGGTFTPSVHLSASTMNNGDHATLSIGVPAGTPSGSYALVYLETVRSAAEYEAQPVAVYVP